MTDLQRVILQVLRNAENKVTKRLELEYPRLLIDHMDPLVDSGVIGGNSWYVKEIFLSAQGGDCPACGTRWVPVHVNNKLVSYTYYKPDCTCYPVCPYCGKVLIREANEGLPGCTNCMIEAETGSGYTMRCREWSEVHDYKGKKRITKKARCGGIMKPAPGGWQCEKCGAVKNYKRVYETWEELAADDGRRKEEELLSY